MGEAAGRSTTADGVTGGAAPCTPSPNHRCRHLRPPQRRRAPAPPAAAWPGTAAAQPRCAAAAPAARRRRRRPGCRYCWASSGRRRRRHLLLLLVPPGRGRPPHPRRKRRRPAWRSSASKQRQWAKRESRFGEQQALNVRGVHPDAALIEARGPAFDADKPLLMWQCTCSCGLPAAR